MTFLFKKIYWSERNYKLDLSGTCIFRLKTEGLIDLLKEHLEAEEILNEDDLIRELIQYRVRFNDSEPIILHDRPKSLKINNELKYEKRESVISSS